MTDIGQRLKRSDPVTSELPLPRADVQRMRRIVAATPPDPSRRSWPRPLLIATTAAVAIAAVVTLGRQLPLLQEPARPGESSDTRTEVSAPPATPTRQLQFETPGGTRIIWVFDPDFQL